MRTWLNQTSVALVYTTERLNIEHGPENFVQTSTVVRNLKFDIDRPTRYFNDIRIHSCNHDSHAAYAFKAPTFYSYFQVEQGSSEIMRWSNGKFFEIQFQIDPDLYEEHIIDPLVFDLIANIGGISLILFMVLSFLLRKCQSETLQERLLGLLYLYQDAKGI